MIKLSKRLQTVAHQVKCGGVAADIGCDHGFTSIYLIEQGLAKHVIAMDINEGPLERAKEHIREYGMEADIETRLSDGTAKLAPGEADTLLISGMGGPDLQDPFGFTGGDCPGEGAGAVAAVRVGDDASLSSGAWFYDPKRGDGA